MKAIQTTITVRERYSSIEGPFVCNVEGHVGTGHSATVAFCEAWNQFVAAVVLHDYTTDDEIGDILGYSQESKS